MADWQVDSPIDVTDFNCGYQCDGTLPSSGLPDSISTDGTLTMPPSATNSISTMSDTTTVPPLTTTAISIMNSTIVSIRTIHDTKTTSLQASTTHHSSIATKTAGVAASTITKSAAVAREDDRSLAALMVGLLLLLAT